VRCGMVVVAIEQRVRGSIEAWIDESKTVEE
jgi:hypothetical protein